MSINNCFDLKVQFKPTKTPIFLTVAGATGSIPSPFVMNPGRWAVTIQIEKSLFVVSFKTHVFHKFELMEI